MNANQISLGTSVTHVLKASLIIHLAKVDLLKIVLWLSENQSYPSISDCKCNPDGSTTLECNENGDCDCKSGYAGQKCDPTGKI